MSSAPAASAAAASPSPAAAPSSNTRRNYYRRSTNTSAATAANDSVQDSTNRIIKNTVFDIGATATPDQCTLLAIESYVQTNYTDAGDVVLAIRNLAPPPALIPPALPVRDPANPDLYQIHVIHYDVAYKANAAAERKYKSHLVNAWGLIYGQCTTTLKSKLEGMTDFTTAKATNDIIALLKLIQGLCCKFDVKSQKYVALAATFRQTFVYFQDNNCSNVDFYHHYKSLLATVQAFGGDDAIGVIPNFVEDELEVIVTRDGTTIDLATDDQKSEAKTKSQERFLAATMLGCTNLTKYEPMRRHLENQFAMGNDNYPQTLEGVFDLMNTFNNGPPTAPSRPRPTYSAAAASATAPDGAAMFAQSSEDIICHDCGRRGHIQRHCPDRPSNRRNTATNATANATNASATNQPAPPNAKLANVHIHTMINEDYYEGRTTDAAIFFQNSATGMLNPNLILLDSCSSHHQFCNPNLVRNIRHTNFPIKVHCNAGTKITTQEADFGSLVVYFNPDGIANVLSLGLVSKSYPVTYTCDDEDGGAFIVTTPSGPLKFRNIGNHLHCADITDLPAAMAAMFVNTISDNYEGYTKREILKAHEARRFQRMIGNPSERDYQGMVREKLIANCPVTVADVKNAHQLFGPDLANLRGKTVRRSPDHVAVDYVDLPLSLLDRHRNVTLTADLMFVNGLPFLITLSRAINLVTIEFASTRTAANLTRLLNRVVQVYATAGLKVQTVMMDMEFQCLQPLMPQVVVNTTAANEHVAEIERRIRVVKERARGIINTLPYPRLPKRIIVELMHFVTMWLNSFPVKGGISQKYSPREIITRRQLDAKLHCQVEFGSYCEVHDEPTPSNTMQRRTHPAICLGPTGNVQGSYKFFCLTTGQLLVRRRWTPMPGIPTTVINAVLKFADKENRPNGVAFRNRHNDSFNFSNDDIDDILLTRQQAIAPFPDIENELPSPMVVTPVTPDPAPPAPNRDELALQAANNAGLAINIIADPGMPLQHVHEPDNHDNANNHITDDDDSNDEDHDTDDDSDDTTQAPLESLHSSSDTSSDDDDSDDDAPPHNPPPATRSGRPRKLPTHLNKYHLYAQSIDASTLHPIDEDTLATVCVHIMVQYANKMSTKTVKPKTTFSLASGLKRFGERGEAAVTKELSQFNVLNAFTPLDASTLTYDQRKHALASLIFLTKKRDGTIKARACANGAPQREHMAKEEVTSPTVSTDATFVLAAIAAHEKRVTATLDLPGAFLHANNDSFVIMKMMGRLAELMVNTAPAMYRKYVIDDSSGKPILYVQLQKALYGMLKSALLFYRKLVSDLHAMGFELNPYDPCVANKLVDGQQLTVSWHVDDLTLSHATESAIMDVINRLKSIYGLNLKEKVGPLQEYLGMTFDYIKPGAVEISMDKYIANVIDSFPEQITGVSATPATDKLFAIRQDDRPLPEEQALHFHHVTAQLLYASMRVRRDIQTTVAFLTTRVKSPGEDDWGKLKRVLKYLNGTRHLHLTLSVDSLSSIKWYIDGSHQIHDDCRGHTGSLMTLGHGAISSTSRKQKINTKSSTETELVAVHDKLGDVLWMRYFLECQGYSIDENVIFQDNMSTLSLEKNGRVSGSNRTKHIKAKYYLVQDKYNSHEIDLKYCPTDTMWADVLTKPLQGLKFRQMRAVLMNCPLDYSDP